MWNKLKILLIYHLYNFFWIKWYINFEVYQISMLFLFFTGKLLNSLCTNREYVLYALCSWPFWEVNNSKKKVKMCRLYFTDPRRLRSNLKSFLKPGLKSYTLDNTCSLFPIEWVSWCTMIVQNPLCRLTRVHCETGNWTSSLVLNYNIVVNID